MNSARIFWIDSKSACLALVNKFLTEAKTEELEHQRESYAAAAAAAEKFSERMNG
jgi:hypothetical protein|tara:strand:- start:2438 stop:2602 length:165 start_codon:yes stop_codon:yes gene_type:complete